jgi:hypothetical protein
MMGTGVCAGTLSRCASGALLPDLIVLSAGDCISCFTPLAPGDPAVLVCAEGIGAMAAEENGFDATGVAAFSAGFDRRLPVLSLTCCRCLWSASLSTITPGVAESRVTGVCGPDTGLCLSFSLSCCFGAGVGAAPADMLSLSLG